MVQVATLISIPLDAARFIRHPVWMRWLVVLLLTMLVPARLLAEDIRVDVELILAVDVSRSMSPRELEIQRRGYAEGLVSQEVTDAIARGRYKQIALTYLEWAGAFSQREIVGWTLIRTPEDAQAFAAKLTGGTK